MRETDGAGLEFGNDVIDYTYFPMRPVVVLNGSTKIYKNGWNKELSVKELMMLDILNEQTYNEKLNVWENDFGYYEKDEDALYWTSSADRTRTLLSNENLANWAIEKYKLKDCGPMQKINYEKLEQLLQIYKSSEREFYIYDDRSEENIYYFKDENQKWCWNGSDGRIGNCGGSSLAYIFGNNMYEYLSKLVSNANVSNLNNFKWNIIND